MRGSRSPSVVVAIKWERWGREKTLEGGAAGRLRPEVPLPFYILFWQKEYPFYIPFIEKRYSFYIPTLEHCTPFLSPYHEFNEQYYGRITSIIRRNVKQTTSIIYSVHVAKQPISLPF